MKGSESAVGVKQQFLYMKMRIFIIISLFGFKNIYGFSVIWNVPTQMCHSRGFDFSHLSTDFGLIQNTNDTFKGDHITILYHPGLFPSLSPEQNGGLPQEGSLSKHLTQFKNDLVQAIPDSNFKGIGVIDFEKWKPIFRENWGSLEVYKKTSIDLEKKRHPFMSKKSIEEEAARRFDKSAYAFMDQTLQTAKNLRPNANWGYYAFPYCYNFSPKNPNMKCDANVMNDNDRSTWMYTGDSLFPSGYIYENQVPAPKRGKMIQGRIDEALRIARRKKGGTLKVYLYAYYKYADTHRYLSKTDMTLSISVGQKNAIDGVVIWGSSNDTNTKEKCSKLNDYTNRVLGPIVRAWAKKGRGNALL